MTDISKEQAVQLARESGAVVEIGLAPVFYAHDQIHDFAKAAFKLGRNAGLDEAVAEASHWQTLSSSHKCGFYIAAAIESLKDNTP